MTKSYYAGMDLDAPCGRCKQETRHRVVTITDGVPLDLICMSCNSKHKFRAEKPVSLSTPRAPRVAAPRAASGGSQFQRLMIEEQGGASARPYAVATRFEEAQWLDHPTFGLGRVMKRLGKKVDVLFKDGLKTLVNG